MSALFDADGFRLACYAIAALTALVAFVSELRLHRENARTALWPTFWLLQAALLVAMGSAMAVDAADALADLARERARADRWYLDRRSLQVPVVASIVAAWTISTVVAIWRVPPRRRRYLPSAALIGALVSFAAARTVSLHHIDTLLYRRELFDVRLVSVVEIVLLTSVTVATVVTISRGPLDVDRAAEVPSPVSPSAALPSGRPIEYDGLGSRRSSGSAVACDDP